MSEQFIFEDTAMQIIDLHLQSIEFVLRHKFLCEKSSHQYDFSHYFSISKCLRYLKYIINLVNSLYYVLFISMISNIIIYTTGPNKTPIIPKIFSPVYIETIVARGDIPTLEPISLGSITSLNI